MHPFGDSCPVYQKKADGRDRSRKGSQVASLKKMPSFPGTKEGFWIQASFFIAAKVDEWYLYHGALEELKGHEGPEGVGGYLSQKQPERGGGKEKGRERTRGRGRERSWREMNEWICNFLGIMLASNQRWWLKVGAVLSSQGDKHGKVKCGRHF